MPKIVPYVFTVVLRERPLSEDAKKKAEADAKTQSLTREGREAKLLEEGMILLPAEGVRVFAEPRLVRNPALDSLNRLLSRLPWTAGETSLAPDRLDAQTKQDLARVIGRSPFATRFQGENAKKPARVATTGTAVVAFNVGGRTVEVDYRAMANDVPKTPTFPEGVPPTESENQIVVQVLEFTGDGADDAAIKALTALRQRRKAEKETMVKAVRFQGQKLLLGADDTRKFQTLTDLPPEIQQQVRLSVRGNYRHYGFASGEEALDAIEKANISGIKCSLDLLVIDDWGIHGFGLGTLRV